MKSMNFNDRRVAKESFDDLYPWSVQRKGDDWVVINYAKGAFDEIYGRFKDYNGAEKLARALQSGAITMKPAVQEERNLYCSNSNTEGINLGPVGNNLA